MSRCIELARMAGGHVRSNPMVGAVLVYEDRVIGEGYHRKWGRPHAEVNCFASVKEEDRALISSSTLYVSLEPCAHYGKTPPCTDLILQQGVSKVVVGCRDPFALVDGKGIEKLRAAGVEVVVGVLESDCLSLNRTFFHFHQQHRPYIILKWAQTLDGSIAGAGTERLLISGAATNRIVHRWRSETMAILVGSRTTAADNPELTTRWWPGPSPLRLVIDRELRLPQQLKLFSGGPATIVYNNYRHTLSEGPVSAALIDAGGLYHYQLANDSSAIHQIVQSLYSMGITSLLVEGGARLLQSFIDEGCWDEARVITNTSIHGGEGLKAPMIGSAILMSEEQVGSDTIHYFRPKDKYL